MERKYTVAEAAEAAGLSVWQVYAEVRAGRLRAEVRRGMSRGYRIAQSELERWAEEEWVKSCARPA